METFLLNSFLGLSIGSTLGAGYSSYYNAKIEADNAQLLAQASAKMDRIEAQNIRDNAAIQSALNIEEYKKHEADLRTTAAHGNLQFSGAFLEAALASMKNAVFNSGMILRQGEIASRARETSAKFYDIEAQSAKLAGRRNQQTAIINTISQLGNIGMTHHLLNT